MSEIRIIEPGEENESLDLQKAHEVAATLESHYPNHPWIVSFQGRVLVVRHMGICDLVRVDLGRDGFGFVLKHLDSHTAAELAHSAMLAGGQMLEAFGLPRGAWDGRDPQIPQGWARKRPETFN